MSGEWVVLLSGGLDSAANLALGCAEGKVALALTMAYGQPAEAKEVSAARKLAEFYGVPHQVVELGFFKQLKSMTVPDLKSDQLDNLEHTRETAALVWIPNRNGVLIQVAAAFAENLGLSGILVGFNREEAVTFPDNSIEFMKASDQALAFSTRTAVKVESFTSQLDKTEIVQKLRKLSHPAFPFEFVWSCYRGLAQPCLTCESCLRFERATRL